MGVSKRLCKRLVLALVMPVGLVTACLYPALTLHLEARQHALRERAATMLEAGHVSLARSLNDSFNQLLATTEQPLLRRYLGQLGQLAEPEARALDEALSSLFTTLLRHHGRYTRLVLLDLQGQALLRVSRDWGPGERPAAVTHAGSDYFREAKTLSARELYLAPPGRYPWHDGVAAPTIDLATPVFDAEGRRRGVLLFSLDWQYLTETVDHALSADTQAQPLLVDAQGHWLLSEDRGSAFSLRFGERLATRAPAIWAALKRRHPGQVDLGEQLLVFQSEDVRTGGFRRLAGTIRSQPAFHPWTIGLVLPKPRLATLVTQEWGLIIALVYGLSIALGLLWALSSHRQGGLKRAAQRRAREVRDLYEHAPCGYHSLDKEGRVVRMNRTELDWLGYRAEEVIGRRFYREFVSPDTRPAFEAAFREVLGPAGEGRAECELITREGLRLPVMIQGTAYADDGGFVHSRGTVFDLTERKRLEATLARQALTDPLTELGNRRYLEDQAVMEIARARRRAAPLGLMLVDIDHFKRINDDHGHDVGDRVLQAFAETARRWLRQGDVLCRLGGEEFAVLLPDTDDAQAMQAADRLRAAIASTPVAVVNEQGETQRLSYTVSVGVTRVGAEEHHLKPALKRADRGLYAAKAQGRNRAQWQAA